MPKEYKKKKRIIGWGLTDSLDGRKRFKSDDGQANTSILFSANCSKTESIKAKEAMIAGKLARTTSFVDQLATMKSMVDSEEFLDNSQRTPILSVLIVKLEELILKRATNLNLFEDICKLVIIILKKLRQPELKATTIESTLLGCALFVPLLVVGDKNDFSSGGVCPSGIPAISAIMRMLGEKMAFEHFFRSNLNTEKKNNEIIPVFFRVMTKIFDNHPRKEGDLELLFIFTHVLGNFLHCMYSRMTSTLDRWKTLLSLSAQIAESAEFKLENLSSTKKRKVLKRFGDIRITVTQIVKIAWGMLDKEKLKILHEVRESNKHGTKSPLIDLYKISLLPPTEIRKTSLEIVFDLIQTSESDSTAIEMDFMNSVVLLFTKGRGDLKYILLVNQIFSVEELTLSHCFVFRITSVMKLLLDYRESGESRVAKITGLVNLAQFFFICSRFDHYRDYIYKLYNLQLSQNSILEAANCLSKINDTLTFGEVKTFSEEWSRNMFPEATTEAETKELLIAETITMMEDAKEHSKAIDLAKSLEYYYTKLDDVDQVSDILRVRSSLMAKKSSNSFTYFFVGFCGLGFPKNFQNTQLIARGHQLERLEDFQQSVLEWFPKAKLLLNSETVTDEVQRSSEQLIQIFPVKARDHKSLMHFEHRRKFSKAAGIENVYVEEKVFQTIDVLPGISTHMKIGHVSTVTLKPVEVALDATKRKNDEIKSTVEAILVSGGDNGHLGMLLQGTIDARINGGLKLYEDAFLNSKTDVPPEQCQNLKEAITDQVSILEMALVLHGKNISPSLLPFHKNLVEMFEKIKKEVISKYGLGKPWALPVRRRCLRKIKDLEELSIESCSSSELTKTDLLSKRRRPVSWIDSTQTTGPVSAYGGSEQSLSERGRRPSKPTEWFSQLIGSQKNLSTLETRPDKIVLRENIQNIRPRRPCSLPRSLKTSTGSSINPKDYK